MRRRDPRRLLARRRRARARVRILHVPSAGYAEDGAIGSKQSAELTLPRAELERMWSPEYLEHLARTYWSFLTKFSLGILRVLYSEDAREVVVLTKPFVLLRFQKPRYKTDRDGGEVSWPIDRGLLVAPAGRGRGYLRLSVRRGPEHEAGDEVTATITSEVVNFYPLLAGWGWFSTIGRFIYNQTQLRIHVTVTHAFMRSLANLELERSEVGALAFNPAARPLSRAASPGRDEP
ncbi:MAG: hypothetical protein ABWY97_06250 [Thermoleophilaceae bacterium]